LHKWSCFDTAAWEDKILEKRSTGDEVNMMVIILLPLMFFLLFISAVMWYQIGKEQDSLNAFESMEISNGSDTTMQEIQE
jgi:hypothetical protein